MQAARVWCRVTALAGDGGTSRHWVIRGTDEPDLAMVDRLARCALAASRTGGRLLLDHVAPELRELLGLVALGLASDGTVEVQREPELREQPLRVDEMEEEGHLGDPTV